MSAATMILLLSALLALGSPQRRHAHTRPTILTPLRNVTATPGETVTLRCSGSSRPPPNIGIKARLDTSFTIQIPEKRGHQDVEEEREAELVLEDLTAESSGWYDCLVVSLKGAVTSSAYLSVQQDPCDLGCPSGFQPICASDCKNYYTECLMREYACRNGLDMRVLNQGYCDRRTAPPTVRTRSSSNEMAPGSSAEVSVEVTGYPEPEVTWYKQEGSAKRRVGTGNSVFVREAGTYFATAVNCINNVARSTTVEVVEVETATSPLPTTSYLTEEGPDNTETEGVDLTRMDSCTLLGGGNIITFDGWKYEFEGECSYVLAMDCDFASWFVYVRFSECLTGRCLDTLTVIDGRLQVPVVRGWTMVRDGRKVGYREGQTVRFGEMTAKLRNEQLMFTIHNSIRIVYDGYSVVQVFVPEGTQTCGICGNNDDDSRNDVNQGRRRFQTADDMSNFVDSWRIRSNLAACVPASGKVLSPSYTCSEDQLRTEEVRNCRKIYSLVDRTCLSSRDLRFLFDTCRYDACFGEEPLAGYSRVCYAGRAMATLCGVDFSEWEEELECGSKREREEAIFSRGCPYQ